MNLQKVTHYTLTEGGPWLSCHYNYFMDIDGDNPRINLDDTPINDAKALKTEDGSIYNCILKKMSDKFMPSLAEEIISTNIEDTLKDRGSRYGEFTGHAKITQDLKFIMRQSPNWPLLSEDKKEALEMTAHKIGRILNGDPEYKDSWVDIEGYIHLVSVTLKD